MRPALIKQDSPCVPSTETISPHIHLCVTHILQPNRSAVDIRNVLLSKKVPTNFDGSAVSHPFDSVRRDAKYLALSLNE